MQLTLRDLEGILHVPADRAYFWIASRGLPGRRIGEQVRFNEVELLDWALVAGQPLHGDLFGDEADGEPLLADALRAGGRMTLGAPPLAADDMLEALRGLSAEQRELAGAAPEWRAVQAVPGIAVPRAGAVLLVDEPRPRVVLFDLVLPKPLGNAQIRHWFWIVSPTVRLHRLALRLLGRALLESEFAQAVRSGAGWGDLVAAATRLEEADREMRWALEDAIEPEEPLA